MQLTCCKDCSANCHREAQSLAGSYRNNDSTTTTTTTTTTTSSSLPSWLQKCKEESKEISTNHEVSYLNSSSSLVTKLHNQDTNIYSIMNRLNTHLYVYMLNQLDSYLCITKFKISIPSISINIIFHFHFACLFSFKCGFFN